MGTDIGAGDLIDTPLRSNAFVLTPDQVLNTLCLTYEEANLTDEYKELGISPITLKPNERYLLNISIKSNEVTVVSTRVTDWVSTTPVVPSATVCSAVLSKADFTGPVDGTTFSPSMDGLFAVTAFIGNHVPTGLEANSLFP